MLQKIVDRLGNTDPRAVNQAEINGVDLPVLHGGKAGKGRVLCKIGHALPLALFVAEMHGEQHVRVFAQHILRAKAGFAVGAANLRPYLGGDVPSYAVFS